jgi:hypothetical protein
MSILVILGVSKGGEVVERNLIPTINGTDGVAGIKTN